MAAIESSTYSLKDGTKVVLRSAVEADAEGFLKTATAYIAENEGQVWEPGEFNKTLEEERTWILGMMKHPREILILAEVNGEIIGNIDFHSGGRRRIAHTGEFGMGMLPEWRSRGLGTLLLGRLIEWAKTVPTIEKINLRVMSNNPRAIGLYKKLGFVQEGRKAKEFKFADGTYADDITMGLFVER